MRMRYKLYVGANLMCIGSFVTIEEVKKAIGKRKNYEVLDMVEKKFIKI